MNTVCVRNIFRPQTRLVNCGKFVKMRLSARPLAAARQRRLVRVIVLRRVSVIRLSVTLIPVAIDLLTRWHFITHLPDITTGTKRIPRVRHVLSLLTIECGALSKTYAFRHFSLQIYHCSNIIIVHYKNYIINAR